MNCHNSETAHTKTHTQFSLSLSPSPSHSHSHSHSHKNTLTHTLPSSGHRAFGQAEGGWVTPGMVGAPASRAVRGEQPAPAGSPRNVSSSNALPPSFASAPSRGTSVLSMSPLQVCACVCECMFVCGCVCVFLYSSLSLSLSLSIYLSISVCVRVCVSVYVRV